MKINHSVYFRSRTSVLCVQSAPLSFCTAHWEVTVVFELTRMHDNVFTNYTVESQERDKRELLFQCETFYFYP